MTDDFKYQPDLLVQTGSLMYGCASPTSDVDTRGFVVEPAPFILGREKFELYEKKEPDHVVWGFPLFFDLLERGAPNVLELLFAPPINILRMTPLGKRMLDSRHLFLHQGIVPRLQGYALSEFRKATDQNETQRLGERRAKQVEAHGISIKSAYHCIRLNDQLLEILKTGNLTFPRPNAAYLKAIRRGDVGLDEVKARFAELDAEIEAAKVVTQIPAALDRAKADDLFYSMIEGSLGNFLSARRKAS
jgi:predicted nucleotidyltransferase